MTMRPELGHSIRLTDAEIPWFLSAARGATIVQATTEGCVPCRLLRPIMEKLAAEFAGRLVVVELEQGAEQFHRAFHD